MSSILDSLVYGFVGGVNLAKKSVPYVMTAKEIIDINRDLFLPITEAAVTEISVNVFGEERDEVEAEIQAINEKIFDPFFEWSDNITTSIIHFLEQNIGLDLDGDNIIGFIDDGVEEPGPSKPAEIVSNLPEMIGDKDSTQPQSGYRPGAVNIDYETGPIPKYNPDLSR